MKNLALKIPGFENNPINSPEGVTQNFPAATLGEFLSRLFTVVLFLASALMFYWLVWGIFHYLFSGGDKEGLGKARSRMTWAIVGFIIIIISFALSQYLETIFEVKLPGGVTPVLTPPR